jgi:hypothetical protein
MGVIIGLANMPILMKLSKAFIEVNGIPAWERYSGETFQKELEAQFVKLEET